MKPKLTLIVKSLVFFFLASILFYLCILNSNLSVKRNNDDQGLLPNLPITDSRLTIAVYYETKCIDSANFISKQLSQAVELFPNEINIVLVPYGNANYTRNETADELKFYCQHGADECFGNILHNCLIFLRPELKDHLPFINCSMQRLKALTQDISIECNNLHRIPIEPIMECAKGKMGENLLYTSALLTDRLNPAKNYVPWIVIDGVHTDEIQTRAETELVKLICDMYKGPKKPKECL